ncbi:hypothetical protein MMRN_38330 [Mycobacterium marinum]|uniref:DUF7257 domain-containing protein n=1 Tax=Mycobacterium marinum TaxID=1781 RepID=UPI000CD9E78A|nr:hypothetical protein [Mycobacterium marinum]AXN50929.1 hypothetical protein CCUG20998_03527 [Mycobacterium marinum]RFZ25473.1 hypothetical protein DSM43519_01659 [Mycobacterium marinum]RFZ28360.1 hypothetical protein DSM44344_01405 [Mycobacterium marinum]RFZ33813.1 hypothetical protein NCTC2275_02659 [Mycobacterium marinum]WOR02980.1 hypothetical protein QDR78_17360 [Mycobacterium marinum]
MTEQPPTWATAIPNYPVHNLPAPSWQPTLPFSWAQLQQIVPALVNEFLRQVAVALGAIEIFGFNPVEALIQIGELIEDAQSKFNSLISGLSAGDISGVVTAVSAGITNAQNAVTDVAAIISSAAVSTAAQVGAALAGAVDGLDDVVDNVIGGATSAVTTFGQAWEGAFAGFLNGINGGSASTAQTSAVSSAMASQREVIVGISTAVAQLQAAAAASGASGVFGGDDFERVEASSLGGTGYWTETYSGGDSSDGYIAIADGHRAAWVIGDPVTRSVFCRRTATDDQYTQTNYQKIVWTVGFSGGLPKSGGDSLWLRLYARVSDDQSEYVFAEIKTVMPQERFCQFGYKNGGSETYIGSPVSLGTYVGAGETFSLWAGDPDVGERQFRLKRGGTTVLSWDDSSTTYAALGSSNLSWGFGVQAALNSAESDQAYPPTLDSITIADNGPGAFDFASLPAAGNAGRTYWCEDVGLTLLDDGTDWRRVWGGPLGYFTAPPSSGWSAVNAGSTTWAANKDAMLFTAPSDGTGSYHLQVRTLTPSSNYTARFNVELTAMDAASTDAWAMGIVLRESSSGKFVTLELVVSSSAFGSGALLRAAKWTNTSTFSAAYKSRYVQFLSGGIPNWVQFRDNGTTRFIEYSHNGVDYQTLYSGGRTDFCTPDQIGVGVFNANTGYTNYLRLRSLDGVS